MSYFVVVILVVVQHHASFHRHAGVSSESVRFHRSSIACEKKLTYLKFQFNSFIARHNRGNRGRIHRRIQNSQSDFRQRFEKPLRPDRSTFQLNSENVDQSMQVCSAPKQRAVNYETIRGWFVSNPPKNI